MVKINTYKSLELNPEIKGNRKGGDTGKTTIQNVKQIIGAKLQKSKN
jgi:hypothetical protein